ncbi:MAG: hypothetical protein ABI835_18870, partial [Chloroflexota bacterium]
HYTGVGGYVTKSNQVFAQVELPTGMYIVFAKAHIAISSRSPLSQGSLGLAYEARLEMGNMRDSLIGSLQYNDEPGSRYESIALNVAGEISGPVRARLIITPVYKDELLVWEPRLSAIRVSELTVTSGAIAPDGPSLRNLVLNNPYGLGIPYRVMRDILDDELKASDANER